MSDVVLNTLKAGISRLRTKGGADPQTLYDLVNGYVTQAGTTESRPGSVTDARGLAGTRGLTVFEGEFYVFSDHPVEVPAGYVCEILTHPTDAEATLVAIHFAKPFMGQLYVVAEWSDDPTIAYHYWLQPAETWQPNTVYKVGALVAPTELNGYYYRANRADEPGPAWAPNVARAVGDTVEPTTYNGFKFTVIETFGANPRSGATEPNWPTTDGAIIAEDTDGAAPTTNEPPPAGGGDDLPPDIRDRYGLNSRTGGENPPTQAQ